MPYDDDSSDDSSDYSSSDDEDIRREKNDAPGALTSFMNNQKAKEEQKRLKQLTDFDAFDEDDDNTVVKKMKKLLELRDQLGMDDDVSFMAEQERKEQEKKKMAEMSHEERMSYEENKTGDVMARIRAKHAEKMKELSGDCNTDSAASGGDAVRPSPQLQEEPFRPLETPAPAGMACPPPSMADFASLDSTPRTDENKDNNKTDDSCGGGLEEPPSPTASTTTKKKKKKKSSSSSSGGAVVEGGPDVRSGRDETSGTIRPEADPEESSVRKKKKKKSKSLDGSKMGALTRKNSKSSLALSKNECDEALTRKESKSVPKIEFDGNFDTAPPHLGESNNRDGSPTGDGTGSVRKKKKKKSSGQPLLSTSDHVSSGRSKKCHMSDGD